jgi:hypothetical protein
MHFMTATAAAYSCLSPRCEFQKTLSIRKKGVDFSTHMAPQGRIQDFRKEGGQKELNKQEA